jgi:hypothetical protein
VRYSATDGSLESLSPAPTKPSWASLPRAARELIDLKPYRRAWIEAHGYFSTNVVSSRGCPYHCNWCAKPISGNRFQLRAPEEVAAESRELKTLFGAGWKLLHAHDLCAIHIASYNGSLYHALRDALHAEVTAWYAPSGTSDLSTCDSLWRRVYEMEPVCRNSNVLSLPSESSHRSTQSAFLPLQKLFAEARRS